MLTTLSGVEGLVETAVRGGLRHRFTLHPDECARGDFVWLQANVTVV
jgi:hypothetical protein